MHIYPTPANLVWTIISIIFIVYSTRALMLFIPALREAKNFTFNGKRKKIAIDLARDYIIGETIRMASHVLSVVIGFQSLLIPPLHSPPANRIHVLYSIQVQIVFIFFNVLSGANSMRAVRSWLRRNVILQGRNAESILQRLERRQVRRSMAAQAQEGERQAREGERQTIEGDRQTREGERQTLEGERLRDTQGGDG